MKMDLVKDFLPTAQWIKPMIMELPRVPLIRNFEHHLAGFGSSFAEDMSCLMRPLGFKVWFNQQFCSHSTSRSIYEMLKNLSEGKLHHSDDLLVGGVGREHVQSPFYFNCHRMDVHGGEAILQHLHQLDREAREKIKITDTVVVDLGTGTYWKWPRDGRCINHLENMDMSIYERVEQTPEDVAADLEAIYALLHGFGRKSPPHFFVTVSPLRDMRTHRDSSMPPLMRNMLMKSVLLLGAHLFTKNHRNDSVYYFPTFEMVVEELRLYDSLVTSDYEHVTASLTPRFLVKRFLNTYVEDDLLRVLPLIESYMTFMDETREMIQQRGAPPGGEEVVRQWRKLLEKSREVLTEMACAPLVHALLDTLQEMKRNDLVVEYLSDVKVDPEGRYRIGKILHEAGHREKARHLLKEAHAGISSQNRLPPAWREKIEACGVQS